LGDELKNEIRKLALQNAFQHDGKTNEKVVLSKILGRRPEQRKMFQK
jgi:glutamyl-tRNA synthetase